MHAQQTGSLWGKQRKSNRNTKDTKQTDGAGAALPSLPRETKTGKKGQLPKGLGGVCRCAQTAQLEVGDEKFDEDRSRVEGDPTHRLSTGTPGTCKTNLYH